MESKLKILIDDLVWDKEEPPVLPVLEPILLEHVYSMIGHPAYIVTQLRVWAEYQQKIQKDKAAFMASKNLKCQPPFDEGITVLYKHHTTIAKRYGEVAARIACLSMNY